MAASGATASEGLPGQKTRVLLSASRVEFSHAFTNSLHLLFSLHTVRAETGSELRGATYQVLVEGLQHFKKRDFGRSRVGAARAVATQLSQTWLCIINELI